MNYWLYSEPVGGSSEAVWLVYSEDAILAHYWEYWLSKMTDHNTILSIPEGTGINPRRCIDDWVTIHWAVPATAENLLNIISAPKPQLIES